MRDALARGIGREIVKMATPYPWRRDRVDAAPVEVHVASALRR
jgi:hypothetical protein